MNFTPILTFGRSGSLAVSFWLTANLRRLVPHEPPLNFLAKIRLCLFMITRIHISKYRELDQLLNRFSVKFLDRDERLGRGLSYIFLSPRYQLNRFNVCNITMSRYPLYLSQFLGKSLIHHTHVYRSVNKVIFLNRNPLDACFSMLLRKEQFIFDGGPPPSFIGNHIILDNWFELNRYQLLLLRWIELRVLFFRFEAKTDTEVFEFELENLGSRDERLRFLKAINHEVDSEIYELPRMNSNSQAGAKVSRSEMAWSKKERVFFCKQLIHKVKQFGEYSDYSSCVLKTLDELEKWAAK